jgi:hypothetical protein
LRRSRKTHSKIVENRHHPAPRSKYNSPIFAVAKKNGGILLIQDFRALNANIHTDKYPMKDFSKCIGNIGCSGSTIFTISMHLKW